ncbi:MAG: hypothetical protein AVDCRST_MAG04-3013, partial [uncultured Acetobacteraceae bacterium]
ASPVLRPDRHSGRGPGARPGPGRCPAGRRRVLGQPGQPHLLRAPEHQHVPRPSPADGPHGDRADPRRRRVPAGPAPAHRPAQPGRRLLLALALHGGPDGRPDRRRPRRPALRPRPVRRLHRHGLLPRPAAADRADRRLGVAGGGLPPPPVVGWPAGSGGGAEWRHGPPSARGARLRAPRRSGRCRSRGRQRRFRDAHRLRSLRADPEGSQRGLVAPGPPDLAAPFDAGDGRVLLPRPVRPRRPRLAQRDPRRGAGAGRFVRSVARRRARVRHRRHALLAGGRDPERVRRRGGGGRPRAPHRSGRTLDLLADPGRSLAALCHPADQQAL